MLQRNHSLPSQHDGHLIELQSAACAYGPSAVFQNFFKEGTTVI